ncbi:MAG: methyltransferase domain-containing protein [Saprospiraceae bacterium]|nr:methyltransferase domain-containing protein [Saprospiraceae bacterium]MDZ4704497.1 methyltransferase domain-containing protein [Saprospiraceae bacterium]
MKPPRWKFWLSYLFEQHLESALSALNPYLSVSLVKGRYQLNTANAVYSFADLYTNFRRAFQQLEVKSQPIQEVLILGFGLGSIPYMLERVFDCRFNYTAVEIDEEVLYLAHKYTLSDISSPIELITADAFDFAAQCETQYDLICMDVFLDDIIPEDFETLDFLADLKRMLSPQGILLYNRLTYSAGDKQKSQTFFDEAFRKIFPDAVIIDAGSNWILVNREVG